MNKSAMQAENWLPWRKSSNAPDTGDTGRPECHRGVCGPCQHRCDHAGPIPCLPLPSSVPPSHVPHHQTLTHPKAVPGALPRGVLAHLRTPSFPPASAIHFPVLPTAEGGGTVQLASAMRGWLAQSTHCCPQHRAVGSWKSQDRRFLHPAGLKQHPPLKDEGDTSSALPHHNRCLAPGSVHF